MSDEIEKIIAEHQVSYQEGMQAYRDGKPVSACIGAYGLEIARAWTVGWISEQGAQAFRNGDCACPYGNGTRSYMAWFRGYNEERAAKEVEMKKAMGRFCGGAPHH